MVLRFEFHKRQGISILLEHLLPSERRHRSLVFVGYQNNFTKTFVVGPITKFNQNVISNFVTKQAYGQMQFCCYMFILPTLYEEDVQKWGGST
jgi:hypothetical protein